MHNVQQHATEGEYIIIYIIMHMPHIHTIPPNKIHIHIVKQREDRIVTWRRNNMSKPKMHIYVSVQEDGQSVHMQMLTTPINMFKHVQNNTTYAHE